MLQINRVSHYQLVKFLGRGAFGTTYLAKDLHLPGHPQCAVKKLNPTTRNRKFLDLSRRLFNTEAETLQKLGQHSQIPRLLAYFEQNKHFYLVQEFIEGHSLSKELKSGKIWSEDRVIALLQDCLNILKFIHDRGVIHRDIKPDNLIRRQEDNKLVLIDFGAVKKIIVQNQLLPTISIGTKGYMPAEQAIGKPRFSSDIYAVGVIAIQALTGIKPKHFKEDENGEIFWEYRAEYIDRKLVKIINKMTRSHFENRYDSAIEVLKDLESLQGRLLFSWNMPKILNKDRFKNKNKNPIYQSKKSSLLLLKYSIDKTLQSNDRTIKNITFNTTAIADKIIKNNSRIKDIIVSAMSIMILGSLALSGMNFYDSQKQKKIHNNAIESILTIDFFRRSM